MIRKSILALTAIAALGTVALAPTSASAWGFKGGWGHHGFGGYGYGYRRRLHWRPDLCDARAELLLREEVSRVRAS